MTRKELEAEIEKVATEAEDNGENIGAAVYEMLVTEELLDENMLDPDIFDGEDEGYDD